MKTDMGWSYLERELGRMLDHFPGVAGVVLKDLSGGTSLSLNGDEVFPTASSIKIHLLAAALELQAQGKVDLEERVQVAREKMVLGSGVLAYLDDPVDLSWRDILGLMIMVSDNTATNLVIDLVGYDRMESFCQAWGLRNTRLQRKMQEHRAYAEDRDNLSTPTEMARMMTLIYEERVLSQWAAGECLRILKKPKRSYIAASVSPSVEVAGKPGAMDHVRCDVGLVLLKRRPYILAVMTKLCQLDPADQERWIYEVARAVWGTMSLADRCNAHGQGIPPELR